MGGDVADGTFRSLLSALGPNKPNPASTGTGFTSGTLIGRPNPIPNIVPAKKKPVIPAIIPTGGSYTGPRKSLLGTLN